MYIYIYSTLNNMKSVQIFTGVCLTTQYHKVLTSMKIRQAWLLSLDPTHYVA